MKNQPPETPHIDVQEAFDHELRQGDREFNDIYIQNRPYQDQEGNVYDPAINEPVKADKYFDNQRQIAKDSEPGAADVYEDMSISALAHKLGEAEFHGDKTSEANISEVLLDKMATLEAKMQSDSDGGPNTRSAEFNQQSSDNLLNRVRGIVDKEVAALEAKQPKSAKAGKKGGVGSSSSSSSSRTTSTLEMAAKRAEARRNGGAEPASPEKTGDGTDTKETKRKPSKQENPWRSVKPNFLQLGKPNEDGRINVAVEFSRKGDVLKWGESETLPTKDINREIIIEGKDGSVVFVRGNHVSHWKRQDGKLVLDQETELADASHLPNTEIDGKEWRLEGWAKDGSADIVLEQVNSAMVKVGLNKPNLVNVPLDKVNGDPFEVLKTRLRQEHFKQKLKAETAQQAEDAKMGEQVKVYKAKRRFLGRLGVSRLVSAGKSVRGKDKRTKTQPKASTQRKAGGLAVADATLVHGAAGTKSTVIINAPQTVNNPSRGKGESTPQTGIPPLMDVIQDRLNDDDFV